ncbi:MAG: glycosyltransferase [Dehalococcoidia bacterium]|nr:glycosyltransferase [Dehalococcoidia bacterium]
MSYRPDGPPLGGLPTMAGCGVLPISSPRRLSMMQGKPLQEPLGPPMRPLAIPRPGRSPARLTVPTPLPTFPGSGRPAPESARRKTLIRGVAGAALVVTAGYLLWRTTSTLDLGIWWIAVPLLMVEIHNGFGLLLFTLALWDVDAGPPWRPVTKTSQRVAVLIPTYNEPEDVLLPAVAAAIAIELPHETWVLDDGRRDWVRALATELGARYLSRPTNEHAKAGNLNHALETIEADLVAIFDADHVASPRFLRQTLCYFDDPEIAVVQTPQDFYNLDSFEHEVNGPGEQLFHEEAVFYRVIAPAKNAWRAAFWCGTGAVVRVAALRDAGGVATDTVTEDIHTTIRMNERGWRAVYHNEVLARGLAPGDAIEYMAQRHRWALGAMQVLRIEHPFRRSHLTPGQWLSFGTTLLAWFDSWRTLAFMVLPVAVLASGASPISAPGHLYGPLFLLTFGMQFLALRLLARGYYPPMLSLVFEVLRMPAVLPATLQALLPPRAAFRVTRKGRAGDERSRFPVPRLHVVLAAMSAAGLVWFAATAAGLSPMRYEQPPAAAGAAMFAALNLWLLTTAMRRIRSARFARERRAGVRLGVQLAGGVDGGPCEVVDLSSTGARALVATPAAPMLGAAVELTIDLGKDMFAVRTHVRRRLERDGAVELGLEFATGQRAAVARAALVLLNGAAALEPPGGPRARPGTTDPPERPLTVAA